MLWNRLGSSLSNGDKPEEPLGAYHGALMLRITYIQALALLVSDTSQLSVMHSLTLWPFPTGLNVGAHKGAAVQRNIF